MEAKLAGCVPLLHLWTFAFREFEFECRRDLGQFSKGEADYHRNEAADGDPLHK